MPPPVLLQPSYSHGHDTKHDSNLCMLSSPSTEDGTFHGLDLDDDPTVTIAVLDETMATTAATPVGPVHSPCATSLSWSNLCYSVAVQRTGDRVQSVQHLLRNVSGHCAPGELLAVMGPSGSGKTTLLEILADRVASDSVRGTIELNGVTRTERAFRAVARYVTQDDALLSSFTVVETLCMAAQLSLPSRVTRAMITQRVERVVTDMGLGSCAHTIVGDVFRKGLSGGQRRRLSIAIELLSNPSILLLDEPTSGLDATATGHVMHVLSTLCHDHHMTIVCTIHQPSSRVFDLFDKLLLLSAGRTVYCGPRADAIPYFRDVGFVCPTYSNPAEYFLALVNDDFDGHADVARLVQAYADSAAARELTQQIAQARAVNAGGNMGRPTRESSVERPSAWRQFRVLLYRSALHNVRNPGIFWIRLAMYLTLSFMVGTMYLSTNQQLTANELVALLFYVQAFLVFMSVAVLPFFLEQRAVFLRERTNAQLNVGSFVAANFLAALPGIFVLALLSSLLVVQLAGLNAFGPFVLNLFLSLVVAESLMHVIGAAVPHYIVGIALGAGVFGLFMLCEGFMVPRAAIPRYWRWAHAIAFHSYSFEAFVYAQFADDDAPQARAILLRLGMEHVDVTRNMLILAGYAVVLQGLFAAILVMCHTGRRR